jgi:hypothetical protein
MSQQTQRSETLADIVFVYQCLFPFAKQNSEDRCFSCLQFLSKGLRPFGSGHDAIAAMASTLPPASPPSSAPGTSAKELKKPFKIRTELLAPSRLTPKAQLLHHNRSLAIQVIAHEVFLLVLACAKCFASADREDAPRIGVLGGGNVGTAVVMTLLANGYRADRIALSTRQPDRIPRCEVLKAPSALPLFQLVPRYYDNARLARESDVLVLCMPPSQIKSVTIQIRHALAATATAPPLVISALCGITQQSLSKACGSQAVVRVRPDVEKISHHWQEQQNQDEDGKAVSRAQTPSSGDFTERDLQPLPLRLASEAIGKNARVRMTGDTALMRLCSLFSPT